MSTKKLHSVIHSAAGLSRGMIPFQNGPIPRGDAAPQPAGCAAAYGRGAFRHGPPPA